MYKTPTQPPCIANTKIFVGRQMCCKWSHHVSRNMQPFYFKVKYHHSILNVHTCMCTLFICYVLHTWLFWYSGFPQKGYLSRWDTCSWSYFNWITRINTFCCWILDQVTLYVNHHISQTITINLLIILFFKEFDYAAIVYIIATTGIL